MRHVIVEGPDGSGKSTLVEFLCQASPLVRHSRASDSIAGPVPDLATWYLDDMRQINEQPPSVYDRHPVISEPIYARYARKEPAQRPFNRPDWVNESHNLTAQWAFVVWCLPSPYVLYTNVHEKPQMTGVREGIWDLYYGYSALRQQWPGLAMHYNYQIHPMELVLDRITQSLEDLNHG
jgi:hypothetical protein